MPASSAVRIARPSGLVSADAKVRSERSGARDLACSSPCWVRGRSVQLVCWPDTLHSVSPWRTSRRSPTARLLGLDGVTAELVAQRGDHLHLRGVVLTRGEPREQGRRDRGQRYRVVDGRLDGPPALAGVLREAAQLVQVLIAVKGVDREVEQPGAD